MKGRGEWGGCLQKSYANNNYCLLFSTSKNIFFKYCIFFRLNIKMTGNKSLSHESSKRKQSSMLSFLKPKKAKVCLKYFISVNFNIPKLILHAENSKNTSCL